MGITNGNGNKTKLNLALEMGMNHWEWEGIALKIRHSRSSLIATENCTGKSNLIVTTREQANKLTQLNLYKLD